MPSTIRFCGQHAQQAITKRRPLHLPSFLSAPMTLSLAQRWESDDEVRGVRFIAAGGGSRAKTRKRGLGIAIIAPKNRGFSTMGETRVLLVSSNSAPERNLFSRIKLLQNAENCFKTAASAISRRSAISNPFTGAELIQPQMLSWFATRPSPRSLPAPRKQRRPLFHPNSRPPLHSASDLSAPVE